MQSFSLNGTSSVTIPKHRKSFFKRMAMVAALALSPLTCDFHLPRGCIDTPYFGIFEPTDLTGQYDCRPCRIPRNLRNVPEETLVSICPNNSGELVMNDRYTGDFTITRNG